MRKGIKNEIKLLNTNILKIIMNKEIFGMTWKDCNVAVKYSCPLDEMLE